MTNGEILRSSLEEDMKSTLQKINASEETDDDGDEFETEEDSGTEQQTTAGKGRDDGGSEPDDSDPGTEDDAEEDPEEDPGEEDDDIEEDAGEESTSQEEVVSDKVEEKADDLDPLKTPPDTWSANGKNIWRRIPRVARKEIKKREEDSRKEYEQNQGRIIFASRMEKVFQPHLATLQQKGLTPEQSFAEHLQQQHALTYGNQQQKMAVLTNLAMQYGVQPPTEKASSQTPSAQMAIAQDPTFQQLNRQVSQLTQQRDEAEANAINGVIREFETATDAQGNRKYPYFSNVAREIPEHIKYFKTQDAYLSPKELLEKAYIRAINANDETRAAIEAENLRKAKLQERQTQKSKIEAAKRKAAPNLNKSPVDTSDNAQQSNVSLRDTMRRTYRKIQNA